MNNLTDKQIGPWLALFHTPQLSLKQKHRLLSAFGTVFAVLEASDSQLESAGIPPPARKALTDYRKRPDTSVIGRQVEQSLHWASQQDCNIITLEDPRYPERLKQLAVPPLLLYVKGYSEILSKPQLAIVGSRNAGVTGIETAQNFARQLSRRGMVVTSGLALGVDGASHLGALEAGQPTIAVMATGIDRIYPRRHEALAQQIVENGALVTEFPLQSCPRPAHFPQRNRIISGLCVGVLVVEAALKSGSLITARFAMEQGREVFAIPGSIHNPLAKGCHALIRQGVKLVETVDDILEEIMPQMVDTTMTEPAKGGDVGLTGFLDEEAGSVLAQVGYEATPMDLLVERTQMPVSALTQVLVRLELERYVQPVSGGYIRLS